MGYYMSGGYYRAGGYYRGGFFSKVGKVLGKVTNVAQKLTPVVSMVNPGLGMAMGSMTNVAGSLGLGAKTASPGAGVGGLLGPSLDFLRGFPASSKTGTPTNILGEAAKAAGLPFISNQNLQAVETPAGTVLVGRKRRSINPLNPRALRRAYRRLTSAERWAHRLFSVSKPRHGVKPKFARRRRS